MTKGRDGMIRITKQTDYGIVLLTHLAAHAERQYNAPELAAEARLPLPMVSKILKLLAREGLLASHRGVKGGYSLARPAEEISMAEIIAALEGPIAITECISVESDCSHEALCPVRANWQPHQRGGAHGPGRGLAGGDGPAQSGRRSWSPSGAARSPGAQLQEI